MWSIFKKEVASFFNSLIAYIVIGVFLLLNGWLFWLYPETSILDYGYAEMDAFFEMCPYVLLFFVPAVTMRMFSEEIRSGTLEFLLTRPVTLWGVIFGKYLSCVLILVMALLPTLVYYSSLYALGNPAGNIDSAAVAGSYFGLVLLSAVYAAIGLYLSSLTRNQVVAFLVAALACYILFIGLEQLSTLFSGGVQYGLSQLGLFAHYRAMGKGVLDSRDLVYFFSIAFVFILLTYISLNNYRK
jgi:ABC-2 type transport system permease protein